MRKQNILKTKSLVLSIISPICGLSIDYIENSKDELQNCKFFSIKSNEEESKFYIKQSGFYINKDSNLRLVDITRNNHSQKILLFNEKSLGKESTLYYKFSSPINLSTESPVGLGFTFLSRSDSVLKPSQHCPVTVDIVLSNQNDQRLYYSNLKLKPVLVPDSDHLYTQCTTTVILNYKNRNWICMGEGANAKEIDNSDTFDMSTVQDIEITFPASQNISHEFYIEDINIITPLADNTPLYEQ